MTDFLIRHFVKDYSDTENARVRSSYGSLAGMTGIVCNALLFSLKLAAGIITGSVSVIADAVNNFSDASSSVVSLAAFALSEKPADKEHPYGHGRYEYAAGLVLAVMIIVIGIELLRSSIGKIIKPSQVHFGVTAIVILMVSIFVKLWLMFFYKKVSKKINSGTLAAASADSRNDVMSTFAVLIGVAASTLTGVYLDGWIGAAVALFIIVSGIGMVRSAISPILGKAPDKTMIDNIQKKILSYDGVTGTHDLMVHDYGPGRQFASVHVEMSSDNDAIENHDVIDAIECDFLKNEGIHMIVHYDPIPPKNSERGAAREWIGAEVIKLDDRITIHDLKIEGGGEKRITLDCAVPADMQIGDGEIHRFITNIARIKYPDCSVSVTVDRSYAAMPH